jgi:L,D-transpeptidase-like protein
LKTVIKIGIPLIFLLALGILAAKNTTTREVIDMSDSTFSYTEYYQKQALKDTIYILSDRYIEVNLKAQTASLVLKNDSIYTYKISSGNPKIHKGMATPSGIFTVQNKTPMATSRQFNNAKLYFWIGFNMNIGFHGLASNGYYRHLGVGTSSHGCLRIGRDDAEDLYNRIKLGTPVIVFDSLPARCFKFSDMQEFDPRYDEFICKSSKKQFRRINKMIDRLEDGEYYLYNRTKYFLHPDTIMKPRGLSAGFAGKVSTKQRKPLHQFDYKGEKRDNLLIGIPRGFKEITDSILSVSDQVE